MRSSLVILASLFATVIAQAGPDVANIYRYDDFYNPGYGNGGGAFRFRTVAASGGSADWANINYGNGVRFWTFCTERTTTGIDSPGYATIDREVYYDGSGPIDLFANPDTADVREVYAKYALAGGGDAGLLALGFTNLNSGNNRRDANRAVQGYIWKNLGYASVSELTPTIESMLDGVTSSSAGRVRAFNTWHRANGISWATFQSNILNNASGTDKQSQLILLVPVPGAVLLGALGLGIAGWVKRRIA